MSKMIDWLHKVEQNETKREAQHQAEHEAAREPAPEGLEGLEGRVIAALRTVFDPELPVNIYDLGLIYGLDVDEAEGKVQIRMTLTAPGCPVAQTFPATVEDAVEAVEGVHEARVDLVWEPQWSKDRMSEAARLELGLF
jgi:FeS assembly SUF system protein